MISDVCSTLRNRLNFHTKIVAKCSLRASKFQNFPGGPPPPPHLAHAHSECASSHTQYIGGGRVGTVEHPQLFGAEHPQLKAVLHNSRHVYFLKLVNHDRNTLIEQSL